MSKTINSKKKKIIIIISLIIFIVGTPLIAFLVKKGAKEEVETYVISDSSENITVVNGVVYAENSNNIFLEPSKGNDYEVKIKEGDNVKKEDVLLVYNSESLDNKISLEESQIQDNKNQLQNLKNKLNEINNKKNTNPKNLTPSQPKEFTANSQIDMNYLESEKDALKEKINMVTNTIKSSEIGLKELKKQKVTFTIKSPIEGKIVKINEGNNPASPIITIESNNKVIKGQLTEYELPNVKVSTKAFVNFKAFDEKYYKSKIIKIDNNPLNDINNPMNSNLGNSPKVSNYEISFEVPKEFKGKTENGFHALIKLGEVENTIKLPKKAVYKDIDKDNKMIWIVKDNKVVSTEIKVKDSGDNYIILSNVTSGSKVILNAPNNLKEGDEVTLK